MANEDQLSILKQGVKIWNEWWEENPKVEIDLRRVNLSEARLTEADFREADLHQTMLVSTGLFVANLSGADTRGEGGSSSRNYVLR